MRDLKYAGKRYLACPLGDALAECALREGIGGDAAVFVPMSEKERAARGYNQSELLARRLSERTGMPLVSALEKTRETRRQAELGRTERKSNLAGAFRVTDRAAVRDKTIVIADDVMTTGSTLSEIAAALKKAGAARVYALTVCSVCAEDALSTKKSRENLPFPLKFFYKKRKI